VQLFYCHLFDQLNLLPLQQRQLNFADDVAVQKVVPELIDLTERGVLE
jgi:hypothetical protein